MDEHIFDAGWCPICGDPKEVCDMYGTCWPDQPNYNAVQDSDDDD